MSQSTTTAVLLISSCLYSLDKATPVYKLELEYRVEKISEIKRVEDELFLLIFILRGL